MNDINEVKLGRVLQHFKSDKTVVILTGFRGDKSQKENEQRNNKIAGEIRKAGYGFFYVDGFWIENQGTEDEVEVSEDSIFAIAEPEYSEALIGLAHAQANKYNQDAIFVKNEDGVFLLYSNGKREKLDSSFKANKLGDFYTKLRGKGKNSTFLFEGGRVAKGYFASLVEKLEKEKNNG